MVELHAGGVNDFVQSVAPLQPGDEGKNLVCRAHLETAGAAIVAVGVEVDRGGGDAATLFGVIKNFVLRHGQHSTGSYLDTGGGAAELKPFFVVGDKFPQAILCSCL